MQDIEILLENKPGALAMMGETLGGNNVSLEGGGVFYNGEYAIAHFLVEDGAKAKAVLEKADIRVIALATYSFKSSARKFPVSSASSAVKWPKPGLTSWCNTAIMIIS